MPSQTESNNALALADKSVHAAVRQIKIYELDGWVVVDQAHTIAWMVSEALQQHGQNCLDMLPFLLSAAAEVRATINQTLAPKWACVQDDDPHMESHPFFPKVVRYTLASASAPAPAPAPAPVPVPASAPAVSLVTHPVPKQLKKCKVLKPLSKAIISNTKDEEGQPGGTIVVVKIVQSLPAAQHESKCMTKEIKQADATPHIGQAQPKGKGKEKAMDIAEPVRGRRLLKASAEEMHREALSRLIAVGQKGQAMKSCVKCHKMKVWCNQLASVDAIGPATTRQAPKSCPRSKPASASKHRAQSRTTRATSHVRQPTPILESEEEEAVEDTDVPVTGDDDAKMDGDAEAEQDTDIATKMPEAIASAADFPADHWQEETNNIAIPIAIPPPIPVADCLSLPSAPSSPTIHNCMLALMAQVTAMQMANENALARMDVMEHDFDTRISSMCAELSAMQLNVGATVTLVDGLVGLVEKLQQEWVLPNPSFPPPTMRQGNESSATALSMRYLNSVFDPSVAPIPLSVGINQTLASRTFGRSDMQGSTLSYTIFPGTDPDLRSNPDPMDISVVQSTDPI
ncbi:hypothetical protein DFJ58DRAFT_734902 [Suillus subalutaceus]|uniref:uncharacterized protein n=1 Tax=Suillus subalutaceus TaxID=48586 RepID=UPI001B86A000|nr:uncharacterized protein DFJ58DRAFT_734902 [Suillus subalutaceus]KAG1836548.1 hypothetical protein DFJ58DRAFT_734902 [Suillus subalutaceus]